MATLSDEYLVKLEEALNLYRGYFERQRERPDSHNFYYSILLQLFYLIISYSFKSITVPNL